MRKTYKILLSLFLILMTGLGFSQSVPSYVPTNGLVGWWGFNGNAQDGSGNGNHGTVNGATLTTDRFGNQNGAYSFLNPTDLISVNPTQVNIEGYTFTCWFKKTSNSQGGTFFVGSNFQTNTYGLLMGVGNNSEIGFGAENGLNSVFTYSNFADYFDNNWHFICAVYSCSSGSIIDSSNLTVLVDNITLTKDQRVWGNQSLVTSPINNYISTIIGNYTYNPNGSFKGVLDDIGIWNRALTPQEITNLYNSQLPAQTSLCLPTITTSSPTSVGVDSVVIGGDISNDGGSSIVLRGICYSTSPNPNMGNQRTEDGSGIGSFNTILRGLTSSTTYYARSYAKNSNGVVVYGNEVSFTTSASLPGLRCPGTPTVTDIDGNVYNTVQIGNQCWTQSNLKVSKYRNGDTIPSGLIDSLWANTTSGAYAIYNNEPVNNGLYGKLYNNYSVTDSRGLCPIGWHVPSEGEWDALVGHVGGYFVAGGSLKSMATQPTLGGWTLPNIGATNSSGFTALPGGVRSHIGEFYGMFNSGCWWSVTPSSIWPSSFVIGIGSHSGGAGWGYNSKECGFSVRCLKNTLPQVNTTSVTNLTPSSALVTGEVISEGGDQNTTRGFCYSTTPNPAISNDTTMNGTGIGVYSDTLQNLTPSTTYYVRAYSTNSLGTTYGNELIFTTSAIPSFACGTSTVSDVDNNTYNTVQIGTQCWTQSNLKTSRYRNGDSISTGLSNSAWLNSTSGAYAIYNHDPVNDGLYGKLYNQYAVTDSRGLCPTGWHVPSDGEWNVLVKYLDPNADTVCGNCWQSPIAGGALKSTAMQPTPGGWYPPNRGATNSSGFTALPGGLRTDNGHFVNMTDFGCWWSSSVFSGSAAWDRFLDHGNSYVSRHDNTRTFGFSVRCCRD